MSRAFTRYLGLRLLRAAVTVWGVVTLVFLLVHVIPGDPIDAILGDQAAPEDRAALRSALRLDRPLPEQYGSFLADAAQGTFGRSFRQRDRTVAAMVVDAVPHTLELSLAAMLFALVLALPLGVVSAVRRGSTWDGGARLLALLGVAIPTIWLGPLLVLAFGVQLRLLPMPGDDRDSLAALVLPAVTVGMALCAVLTRQTRAALLEVLSEQYILAARARGVPETTLLFKHALRNALLPITTVAAAQLGALLSGTVITEKIFERPGLGSLFLEAFFDRDIPVVQGCVLVIAVVYVAVNLLLDLLYGVVDPRVRLS
jgi:peptide/nickel transport system permease protein